MIKVKKVMSGTSQASRKPTPVYEVQYGVGRRRDGLEHAVLEARTEGSVAAQACAGQQRHDHGDATGGSVPLLLVSGDYLRLSQH